MELGVSLRSRWTSSQKDHISGFLPRTGTGNDRPSRSLQNGFRTNTVPEPIPVSLDTLDISGDEKGHLGLVTLHDPQPPIVPVADIVFIHGLGGGSRKSWSYSADPRHFWPRSWLPADDDFRDVRVHTFGYKADWGERRHSVLDIHGFAQSLLGALRNHPGIRRTNTRIVLVGHSMGGCVAKKTYILARQDPTAADFAGRVHSMFFLATPHHGSNLATILENMLSVAWGKKPFVTDLMPNSAALTAINDTFRHLAPELRLWSFYETLPMRGAGAMNRIVVDMVSATLGYHNEEIAAMDADHRQVCKFDTPADPNYRMLRNALLTAVDLIRKAKVAGMDPVRPDDAGLSHLVAPTNPSISPAEATSLLRSFLGIQESPEGDLATLQVLKQPGSCEWFTERPAFSSWKEGTAPGILWLVGRPATGKSVLASHIIEQLQTPHAYCSYFIFKHAKAGDSMLGDCFRSLAYQMAMQDGIIKDALLQLVQDGLTWGQTDDASVWRRLFTGCIFKLSSLARHFWVMDGVDECANSNALFTKRLLATLPENLRLFATSRDLEEIERGVTSLGPRRASMQVLSDTDTAEDMRLFLITGLTELGRPETPESRELMCNSILERSSGSFLWARLVLQEFQDAWTEEAMETVLSEVPADLHQMYLRMVQSIEQDRRKLLLAKSILTWVVLASRPLTTGELRCAVKLDTKQTLHNPAKAIPDLCGQLVFIDKQDKVLMIHETAREFLLDDTLDLVLSIHKQDDHTRLALLSLEYLVSGALKTAQDKPQQSNVRSKGFAKSGTTASTAVDVSLLDYTSRFFSEHLYRATSSNHDLMASLSNLLSTNNVLAWIEHVAKGGDLAPLPQTAMNLREYLGRRMKYVPPTDRSAQLVDGWVTDLIRVAAKFRAELLACPSSIHSLIPSLCPSESRIARTFGLGARQSPASFGFAVNGLPPGSWDDCLIRMDFQKGQTTTVSHGEGFFAIGLSTGQISLYDPDSLQVIRQFKHPERVRLLAFSQEDFFLASCGAKNLVVWDPKAGTALHSFPLRSTALAITFLGLDEILGAFQSSELTKWDLATGEHQSISWKDGESEGYPPAQSIVPKHPPSHAAFLAMSPDEVLLAVGYRAHPMLIWNALELQLLGTCEPDITNNGLNGIVFGPNPEVPALVVSYQEGSLCVFDYMNMEMQTRRPDVYATSVSCSSDGRTIITGSGQGGIEIFELEESDHGPSVTLKLIYRSNHPLDDSIRGVAFSHDALRFIDVRGRQGRVWAPAALVRKSTSELDSSIGSSEADAALLLVPKASNGMLETRGSPKITSALVSSADGKFVIAGKSNGDVVVFSTADAKQVRVLCQHARGTSIIALALVESRNLVVSADDAGRVLVSELQVSLSKLGTFPGPIASIILDQRFGGAVVSVLANAAGDRVFVHGRSEDQVWAISSGEAFLFGDAPDTANSSDPAQFSSKLNAQDKATAAGTCLRSVFQHPTNPGWFVIVTRDLARIYSWADIAELTPPGGIQLIRESTSTGASVTSPASSASPASPQSPTSISWETATSTYHTGPNFVIELFRPTPTSSARLYLWPAAELDPNSVTSSTTGQARPASERNLDAIGPAVSSILRVVGPSTIYFLDVRLWICSVELQSVVSPPGAARTTGGVGFGAVSPTLSAVSPPSSASLVSPSPSSLSLSSLAPSSSFRNLSGRTARPTPTALTSARPHHHARRHFFALSEWRTWGGGGDLRCVMAAEPVMTTTTPGRVMGVTAAGAGGSGGGKDVVVFSAGSGVVVVQGGLEFVENVVAAGAGAETGDLADGVVEQRADPSMGCSLVGLTPWRVVSGSMHRRGSGW
ncbi:hypothetical protein B0J18DRAFT_227999 [Chaetomium sp. MPI-SDFR-AT-0129]|nr:hypothetical protein B0J18DRAFT_227999 [Chaetomium sp. MPI-SDFR-AT-0129]